MFVSLSVCLSLCFCPSWTTTTFTAQSLRSSCRASFTSNRPTDTLNCMCTYDNMGTRGKEIPPLEDFHLYSYASHILGEMTRRRRACTISCAEYRVRGRRRKERNKTRRDFTTILLQVRNNFTLPPESDFRIFYDSRIPNHIPSPHGSCKSDN